MPLIKKVLFIMFTFAAMDPSAWGAPSLTCEGLFSSKTERVSRLSAKDQRWLNGYLAELAQLQGDLRDPESSLPPTVRHQMVKLFEQKWQELESRFPADHETLEMKLERQILRRQSRPKTEDETKLKIDRQLQVLRNQLPTVELHHLTPIGEKEMNTLTSNWVRNTDDGRVVGTGVMWTNDSRFLAIRPLPDARDQFFTFIYDLQGAGRLKYTPAAGILSRVAPVFAEVHEGRTRLVDLLSETELGNYEGLPLREGDLITPEFVVTQRASRSQREAKYVLEHQVLGRISLGRYFSYAAKSNRLAYFVNGRLRILDLGQGTEVPLPASLAGARETEVSENARDLIVISQKDRRRVIFLDDLSLYDIKEPVTAAQKIVDKTIVAQLHTGNSLGQSFSIYHFENLQTGQHFSRDALAFEISGDRKHVLIQPRSGDRIRVYDLATMSEVAVPQWVRSFTPSPSPWLQQVSSRAFQNDGRFRAFHPGSQAVVEAPIADMIQPLGESGVWLVDRQGEGSELSLLKDQAGDSLRIGDGPQRQIFPLASSLSPDYSRLLTVRDGRIAILDLHWESENGKVRKGTP